MIATSGGPATQNSHPGDCMPAPLLSRWYCGLARRQPTPQRGGCACVPCPVYTQQETGFQKSGKWVGSVPERHPAEPGWPSIMWCGENASLSLFRDVGFTCLTTVVFCDHPSLPTCSLPGFPPRRLAGAAYREDYAPLGRRKMRLRLDQVGPRAWSWWTPESG